VSLEAVQTPPLDTPIVVTDKQVRNRLRFLNKNDDHYVAAHGAPSPEPPRGLNADLNQRILDRLAAEGRPKSDYPKILDAILAEG
jgi:hypothetical protein